MKKGRRIVPELLTAAGSSPIANGGTNAPAEGPAPPAPPPDATRSEAEQQEPQPQPQEQAAHVGRAAFRTPAAHQAPQLSAAEQLRHLEEQQVADVAAELDRLRINYSATAQDDQFAGIQLDLKQLPLEHLKEVHAPALDQLTNLEGGHGYPEGLHDILKGSNKLASLSRQPLLGRPSLLVRASCAVKKGRACGCLTGRLTDVPADAEQDIQPHQIIIPPEDIQDSFGAPQYKGPDLLLDMNFSSNEFRFLPDTVLRPEEGNVKRGMYLVRDAKQGLSLPLITVIAVRDIEKGEELVALSRRDTAPRLRALAAPKRQAADEAAEKLAHAKQQGSSPAKVEMIEDKAAAAEKEAVEAEAAAKKAEDDEAEQLSGEALEQLLPSGWRQHTLDIFFRRHADLAAKLAGSKAKGGQPLKVKAALAAAVKCYYGGKAGSGTKEANAEEEDEGEKGCSRVAKKAASNNSTEGTGAGGSNGDSRKDSGKSDSSGGEAADLLELQSALEESLLHHPPPLSVEQLRQQLTLSTGQRFRRVDSFEQPLQQRSDFGLLTPEICRQLDGLKGTPQELPEGCRDQLDGGACFPGIHVCEVAARLHRVRLLTPPKWRALSMHAPAKGKQLEPDSCACIYVGSTCDRATQEEANPDSAYVFDITADEIAEASGGRYCGPGLAVDADDHRNEAAFANCVFGSGRKHNLKPQAVWDPKTKRPHMALVYTGEKASEPGEELLLDYGFQTYWAVQVAKVRQAHEEYATLAGEVIVSLRAALKEAGASQQELADCLLPVDLAKDHQEYRRVEVA